MNPRYYPDTRTRILRARERGILSQADDRNPYQIRASGGPLWEAWAAGRAMAKWDRANTKDELLSIEDQFDLTEQFRSLLSELDATLPDAWPQEGAA